MTGVEEAGVKPTRLNMSVIGAGVQVDGLRLPGVLLPRLPLAKQGVEKNRINQWNAIRGQSLASCPHALHLRSCE